MTKQYVTYEISLKLKELGFDEFCYFPYNENGEICQNEKVIHNIINNSYDFTIFDEKSLHYMGTRAPLWQQVIDWFLEKYKIHIEIELTDTTSEYYFQYCIVTSNDRDWNDEECTDSAKREYDWNLKFDTKYECMEKSILKVIELIK